MPMLGRITAMAGAAGDVDDAAAALLRLELVPAEWNFGLLMPEWWPAIAWPYYVFIGSTVTLALGILFKSKRSLE